MISKYDKIAITGYALTGKTRISRMFDRHVIHTDDYIGNENEIVPELKKHDIYVVEGVYVANLLRGGLKVDLVIKLEPKFDAELRHTAQRKAVDTIFGQWLRNRPKEKIIMMNEDVLEMFLTMEKAVSGVV